MNFQFQNYMYMSEFNSSNAVDLKMKFSLKNMNIIT